MTRWRLQRLNRFLIFDAVDVTAVVVVVGCRWLLLSCGLSAGRVELTSSVANPETTVAGTSIILDMAFVGLRTLLLLWLRFLTFTFSPLGFLLKCPPVNRADLRRLDARDASGTRPTRINRQSMTTAGWWQRDVLLALDMAAILQHAELDFHAHARRSSEQVGHMTVDSRSILLLDSPFFADRTDFPIEF